MGPDPPTIQKQKDSYMKMLDAQVKHQKEYLLGQADQQKKQFIMQIDMEVKQEEMQKQQFEMEKKQQEMQMKMQEEMAKFQGAGQLFTTPALGTAMPGAGQTYTYGPNGELIPK